MNNRFSRLVCGFLSVVMCIFSTVHVTNISAAGMVHDVTNSNVITIGTSEICKINGSPITPSTEAKNGDSISVNFVWSQNPEIPISEYPAPVTFAYNLSSHFHNVNIGNQDLGTSITNTHYYIEDNILYIEITEGTADRSGKCYLEGTIDIDQSDLQDEKAIVKLFNSYTLPAPSLIANVTAGKSAGSLTYDEVTEKYYQHFTAYIKNDVYNDGAYANNIVISDTYPTTSEGGIYSGDMCNFKVTTVRKQPHYNEISRVTEEKGNVSPDYTVTVDKLNAQEEVIIEYDIEVDPESVLDSSNNRMNTIKADYNNGSINKSATGTAYANPVFPSASKTSSMSQDKSSITWTISIDEGYQKDIDTDTFTVVDRFGSVYVNADDIIDEHPGVTVNADGTVTIDKSQFTASGNGKYTFTYTSDVPESLKNSIFSTSISNNADVVFTLGNEEYKTTVSANENISGEPGKFVEKSGEKLADGKIRWTFDVSVPDDENIKSVNIYDSCTQNQKILYTTMTVKNGSETLSGLGYDYCRDNEFQIWFGETWTTTNDLSLIKGKTLTFTYETEILDTTSAQYQNTVNAYISPITGNHSCHQGYCKQVRSVAALVQQQLQESRKLED